MTRSLAIVVAIAAGCGSDPAPVARLTSGDGTVEASRAKSPSAWTAAAASHAFFVDDGVRTGASSRAEVEITGGAGVLRMGPHSLVRFGDGGTDGPARLELEAGEAEVETGDEELLVDTGGAPTRVRTGSRVRLIRDADGRVRLEVVVGTATIESDEGNRDVASGEELVISAGGITARARPPSPESDAAPPAAAPRDAGPATAIALPGGSIAVDPQPSSADFSVHAGTTATVHDPSPPTNVRLLLGKKCEGPALVEVRARRTQRLRGTGEVIAALPSGRHRYSVRCGENGEESKKPVAAGTLWVRRDSGRSTIETSAPENAVDADGRTYRLLYQNRMPNVLFSWPRAPEAGGYVLNIESATGKRQRIPGRTPKIRLSSGAIREGKYRFWFATDGASEATTARSQVSTLELDFDNAAPAAQLQRPAPSERWAGGSVRVSGLAIRGASVAVDGVTVPLDDHHRFTTRVAPPVRDTAIAVRISHPRRGIHYYVRRSANGKRR